MSTTVEEIEKTETGKDTKSELLLDSLEIKGYRCFEHLTIEKLGRVNLIVGKNNVGKTALLEALWIYAQRGNIATLINLLLSRDEISSYQNQPSSSSISGHNFNVETEKFLSEIKNLFYERKELSTQEKELASIGAKKSLLKIKTVQLKNEDRSPKPDLKTYFDNYRDIFRVRSVGLSFVIELTDNNERQYSVFFSLDNFESLLMKSPPLILPSNFIKSDGLNSENLARLWDEAIKNSLEEKAKYFLQTIAKNISYINFVGAENDSGKRYAIASIQNSSQRFPLKSFGEGLTRLLGLSLSFIQCQNGILLIDEVENGLHYSVLLDVWRLIFKTARDLNVQVFVTTHSSDCVKAFQRAAEEDREDEGMLIRLVRKGDKIKAVLFDEGELETIVENNIEVR